MKEQESSCELCSRSMPLTFHHLIPKSTHKKWERNNKFTKEQMQSGTMICRQCHSAIHRLIPDAIEMALNHNSVDKLLENEAVVKWCKYASKLKGYDKNHQKNGLKFKR